MKLHALSTTLAIVALAGCTSPSKPVENASTAKGAIHCDSKSGLCFRVDTRGQSCGAKTWVGRKKRMRCPQGTAGDSGLWALEPGSKVQPDTYCRYEWTTKEASSPDAKALAALDVRGGFDDFAPDCEVVVPSAETIDATWPELERAFHIQTERLSTLPAGSTPFIPTRVEVIDSAVTLRAEDGEPSKGRLEHGRAMGLIVRNLACPEPGDSCRATVASTLALPLVEGADGATVRDEENGGFFGSILDLALAIEDAVVAWRQDASDRPLVINMSLGWPSIHGGAYQHVEELPAPVRAVWDAIAKARCYGAAVVASTGNRTEGPSAGQGPLYPAGWASKTAPSVDTCHALGVEEVAEGYDESGPLVFAVGGLEANDADLGLGRQQARPRWVAPAAHAVVADGDEHSALQTGTSVASAVTAAAAAIVWSYRPELSADEVFDVVYEGGADIGRPVELCVGGCEAQTARRVSICGAVMQACSGQEGVCPAELPACERMPGGREVRPDPQALVPAAQRVVSASMVQHQASVGWPCFGDVYASSEDVANPCPAAQFFGAATLGAVGPQPRGTPICPHCVYSGASQQLEIIIDDNTAGTVTNPVLAVVVDSSSSDVRYFDLSDEVPPMTGGERTTVTDLDLGTPTYESATIEFLIDGATAERSPVLTW